VTLHPRLIPTRFRRFFDICSEADRALLREVAGVDGEQQIYNFCSTHRQDAMPLSDYGDVDEYQGVDMTPLVKLGDPLDPKGYDFPCRRDPDITEHMSAKDVAQMLTVPQTPHYD
jgi:hypothetical protein